MHGTEIPSRVTHGTTPTLACKSSRNDSMMQDIMEFQEAVFNGLLLPNAHRLFIPSPLPACHNLHNHLHHLSVKGNSRSTCYWITGACKSTDHSRLCVCVCVRVCVCVCVELHWCCVTMVQPCMCTVVHIHVCVQLYTYTPVECVCGSMCVV